MGKVITEDTTKLAAFLEQEMKATCNMLRCSLKCKLPGKLDALIVQYFSDEI
jgi:hypothetical protein